MNSGNRAGENQRERDRGVAPIQPAIGANSRNQRLMVRGNDLEDDSSSDDEDDSSSDDEDEEHSGYLAVGNGNNGGNLFRLKVDISNFDGHANLEETIDWISEVERFFEFCEIPEDRRVKFVAYRLKGGAVAWWDRLQFKRKRQGKRPINT